MSDLAKRLRYYSKCGMNVGPEELQVYAAALEQLEAALIELDNGHIRCLVCHNETYAGQIIQHKSGCLLFAKGAIDI